MIELRGRIESQTCPVCRRPLKFALHALGEVYFLTCPPCGIHRWGIPGSKTARETYPPVIRADSGEEE